MVYYTRKMNMKRVFIIFLMIFFVAKAFSQNNFKEVYEGLEKNDRFSNMMKLRQYQEMFPKRAITYFLLGNIFDSYMREADPLVMFDILETNYRQYTIYFELLKSKLDDRQAIQDREYFGPVEIISEKRKARQVDIMNEIDKRFSSANEYFQNAYNVHYNYIKCINKYNECLFRYRDLTRAYPDYKTLFLITTPRIQSDIEKLSLNFDSVLVYFNSYKEACKKIPNLLKVKDYEVKKIVTYRLEGLTDADFTAPIVQFWDYKSWSDHFINLLSTDIATIHKGIAETDLKLSEQARKLKTEEVYYPGQNREDSRNKLHYLTGKYDYASITNDLLAYKYAKIQFLADIRSKVNDPGDTLDFDITNKLMFYKDLADANIALNNQAERLKKSITIDNTSKYMSFFFDRYKGMDGFARWCEMEKPDNDEIFDKNLKNLHAFYTRSTHPFGFQDSIVTYNRKKITFFCQKGNDFPVKDTLITHRISPFMKRWFYLDGTEYLKNGTKNLFLSKVNPQGKIDWMISPALKGFKSRDDMIQSLQITDDSTCWILGQARKTLPDSSIQSLTYKTRVNWNGKVENQHVVDSTLVPVYFWVDEINEQYLVILVGSSGDTNPEELQPMKVKLYNYHDSLVWQHTLYIKGDFLDVVHTNSDLFMTVRYATLNYAGNSGNVSLTSKNPAIAGIYIRQNGFISHINDYRCAGNVENGFCKKVYDNTLNIFTGLTGERKVNKYLYILTDNQGIPTFSNDKELEYVSYKLNQ
jgi:hypothetical protein